MLLGVSRVTVQAGVAGRTDVGPDTGRSLARMSGKCEFVTGEQWGRVDADGTVWVRTADGERAVGQYPGATEEEALAYFSRKYEDLRAQVDLLVQRLRAGHLSPQDAAGQARRLRETVSGANAVGDLDGLTAKLEGIEPAIAEKRAEAEHARVEARERALAVRVELVEEAEAIADTDAERVAWKTAGDRLRELFDRWRTLQRESRLDKATEDELWKRFSHARTTFDRKRRQYFGALDEQRSLAKKTKEDLVARAEELQASTDWASTASSFRQLMEEWKAAGRAARKDDDALWARFRAAQDAFFAARNGAAAETDAQFRENLTVKEGLLVEAEALLPVTDAAAARSALRDIQDRWDEAGKVPRADLGRVEGRLRAVEQAVRGAEQDRWKRDNPEARARAENAVAQLERTLDSLNRDLETARAAGKARAITDLEQSISAREEWLEQARQALAEFGG